jgi:hypothetical protein
MRLPNGAPDTIEQLLKGEYHARTAEHQPILLSSAAVSAAKDSHRRPTSRLVSGSSTAISNSWKNLAETILVPVVRAAVFKKWGLNSGSYDGERRNHFF